MQTETETPTLEALLREWATIEPDHCKVRESGEYGSAPVVHLDGIGWDHMPLDDYDDLRMCTQFAVQQAIEARGWSVNIIRDFTRDRKWFSRVVIYMPDGDAYGNESDTPAEAILSAYIQALEARQ